MHYSVNTGQVSINLFRTPVCDKICWTYPTYSFLFAITYFSSYISICQHVVIFIYKELKKLILTSLRTDSNGTIHMGYLRFNNYWFNLIQFWSCILVLSTSLHDYVIILAFIEVQLGILSLCWEKLDLGE